MNEPPRQVTSQTVKLRVARVSPKGDAKPAWYRHPEVSSRKRVLWVYPSTEVVGQWKKKLSGMKSISLVKGAKAIFMPLGVLTAISYFPRSWEHRLLDEACGTLTTEDDLRWADVVCFSGMYIEAGRINDLARRARALGRTTVIGGPAVALGPQRFPDVDILHVGELGNATYELIRYLDGHESPPEEQQRFTTTEAFPINEEPLPAWEMVNFQDYLTTLVQYSKGCPFNCEFCDVIEIFGRVPQTKTPSRFLRELDLIYALGWRGQVLAVTDNFNANHRETREVLPEIARWQEARDYPFSFVTAATLDVAQHSDILEKFAKAGFAMLGIGIESAEAETLVRTQKKHNLRSPIAESVRRIHDHGIEVGCSFILGFDSDTRDSGKAMVRLIRDAHLPMASVGMLVALDGTQLARRVAKENRGRSEFPFMTYRLGDDVVREMFEEVSASIYDPADVFERFTHQVAFVRPKRPRETRITPRRALRILRRELRLRLGIDAAFATDSRGRTIRVRPAVSRLPMAARTLVAGVVEIGLMSRYRSAYWKFIATCVRHRDLASAIAVPAIVSMRMDGRAPGESTTKVPSAIAMPPTTPIPVRPASVAASGQGGRRS
jgi:hopanoid C-2 methylase